MTCADAISSPALRSLPAWPPPGCRRPRAAPPAPHAAEARHCHLQHREGLGHPDDHQEPDRSRIRRRRAADDAQARRGDHAAGGRARADVRKQFEASPVKIGGLGTTCEFHSPDPAVVRKNIDETKEWVKLAQDLGSPSVKVRPNGLPQGRARGEDARADRQVARRMRRVCARQRRRDPARSPRRRDASACRGSGRCFDYGGNHPNVRACWNSNQTDLLDGGFDANFKLLRDQIGQVHMRDLLLEEYPWRQLVVVARGDEVPAATALPRSRSQPTRFAC